MISNELQAGHHKIARGFARDTISHNISNVHHVSHDIIRPQRHHKASQGIARCHNVSLTRYHKVSNGLTKLHTTSQGITRHQNVSQVSPGITWFDEN